MHSRNPAWLQGLTRAALVLACLLTAMACGKGSMVGASHGTAPSVTGAGRTIGGETLQRQGGLCDDNRRISKPELDSQEWVIWRMYELALGPDTDENFDAFRQLFPSSRNTREIREMYWSRMRNIAHKFAATPGKPDYVICRTMDIDIGRKYFIVSSDPRQTPPPVTIGESEGKNRILFLTPF
jgi:hypothetical protein